MVKERDKLEEKCRKKDLRKVDCDFLTILKYGREFIIQNYLYPVRIYLKSLMSPCKLNQGYLKVAGLFFSKKK